ETFRALMEMREKYNAELALHQRQQDLHLVATQIQQVEALRAKFDVCWDYTQNKLRDDKRAVWQEVQNQSGELTRIRAQWGEAFNTLVRELQQAATGTQQSVEHTQGVVEILAREQKFSAEQAELRRLETVNLNERLEAAEEDRKAMRKDMDDLRNEVRKLMRAKGPQNPEVVMEDPEDDPGDPPEEAPQPSRQASRGWN